MIRSIETMEWHQSIKSELAILYGRSQAAAVFDQLVALVESYRESSLGRRRPFSEKDVILISYGNSLQGRGRKPLSVLKTFADRHLKDCFSGIHLLPFFPFSSDDGFSVTDFLKVNPMLGGWEDIKSLSESFDIMFDFVLNHISAESEWFGRYLSAEPEFRNLAIEVAPETDLSRVVRPRTTPLLAPFTKSNAETVWLWTTFSPDQVDLNYARPELMLKMVEVLLNYIQRGARLLRLDAVAYLWKEIGTTCIHLPQTHSFIRLLRCILDQVAPEVLIVTETNVPHAENISYFGDGTNEAQMVYNFTLPPLLLHAMLTADTGALNRWAQALQPPAAGSTFFNFTASHDGIGVRPLEGILSSSEIEFLMQSVVKKGGRIAFGQDRYGRTVPYELNITYIDAVSGPKRAGDPMGAQRFLASQAVAMALPGVPGVYLYGLLGSRNWSKGVQITGRARTINRRPLQLRSIAKALGQEHSFRSMVFKGYCHLLRTRRIQPAFHPHAESAVLSLSKGTFALRRVCPQQTLFALTNLSPRTTELNLDEHGAAPDLEDVLTGRHFKSHAVSLQPYQTVWLTAPDTIL